MEPIAHDQEVAFDFPPLMKVYKDGRVERIVGIDVIPPCLDLKTNVESRDVVISPESDISARLYIPKITNQNQKLPLLVYFHGGGFCVETPFSSNYHNYANSVASQAQAVVVSVNYRRAPEHPIPIAHEDSWAAVKWVASHLDGNGPEDWLNLHANLEKVFFAGDSAGANISHHMAIRVGTEKLKGIKLQGIVLLHPFFWGVEPVGSESAELEQRARADQLWRFACPTTTGSDDPIMNPAKDKNLGSLGCGRVLIFVAEEDTLRSRGWYYKELLEKSEWDGVVEIFETKGENHVFHLINPSCENAVALLNHVASFINQN
ncbi:Alpha/beta hydrolase fold [Quillaja saponaria]|uniref:Alpha/beta hydrolase fold n=1 Tax=Quillaja saponaria TaxID=32244 RepID=A0AAD7KUI1_QUISA|nr:Alpha/beta hydrolase fold [Quillaja saponaria]